MLKKRITQHLVVSKETQSTNGKLPWQLKMFQKSLKKRLRLREFAKYLEVIGTDQACLLVTCGDNNGAMNHYLRKLGGKWTWADLNHENIAEMSELLGDEVILIQEDNMPFAANSFDYVISIDVHEHIQIPKAFTREMCRIAKQHGTILITVPGRNEKRLINKMKVLVGMSKEKYGHVRDGFNIMEMKQLMTLCQIEPTRASTFSRFFTELLELTINTLYVKVLSTNSKVSVPAGTIAPQTEKQLKSMEKTYRLYTWLYPFFWFFSKLDNLLLFMPGYVIIVEGVKKSKIA